jgi:hypothetical protein
MACKVKLSGEQVRRSRSLDAACPEKYLSFDKELA